MKNILSLIVALSISVGLSGCGDEHQSHWTYQQLSSMHESMLSGPGGSTQIGMDTVKIKCQPEVRYNYDTSDGCYERVDTYYVREDPGSIYFITKDEWYKRAMDGLR
jgi:hypothetical protein